MKKINILEATRQNVKAFGQLVARPKSRPTGKSDRLLYWKQQAQFSLEGGKAEVGFLVVEPFNGVYTCLETHLETAELLVPLTCDINVVVAPAAKSKTDKPQMSKVKAFRIRKGSAILLKKGVWHYLPQPVSTKAAEILVVFADNTSQTDLIMCDLSEDETFKIVK